MVVLTPVELLDKLDRCLTKFHARIGDKCDGYVYWPNEAESVLGSGAQGCAFRMKMKETGKVVVIKEIPKSYVAKSEVNLQHLAVELAVTRMVQHVTLNHCVDLIHNDETIFLVLEACDSSKGDLSTRLYFLMAKYNPSRFPQVPKIVRGYEAEAGERIDRQNYSDEEVHVLRCQLEDQVVKKTCLEFGFEEDPEENSLYGAIVHAQRIPEGKAAVIAKQILEGLQHLHGKRFVHRDIKTENIVLGERRRAIPICDPIDNPDNVVGVRLLETVDVRIIDFGLAKYLDIASNTKGEAVRTPSPSHFAENPWSRAVTEDFDVNETAASTPVIISGLAESESPTAPPPQMSPTIPVTPCGTHIYCSLEVLNGILGHHRKHYVSTKRTLPKFDIHGAGAALFCMLNGRPPYRSKLKPNTPTFLQAIRAQMKAGAVYNSSVSDTAKEFCMKLMSNEISERPDARVALQDNYFKGVTRRYVTEVTCDGERRVVADAQSQPMKIASISTSSTLGRADSDVRISSGPGLGDVSEGIIVDAEESEADIAAALRQGEAALNEVLRFDEDDGDCRGKDDAEDEE